MQTMPLRKQLSYLFSKATGRDVMTSRMMMESSRMPIASAQGGGIAYHTDHHSFRWYEARPALFKDNAYSIVSCSYSRHAVTAAPHDKNYLEHDVTPYHDGSHFVNRDQAVAALLRLEKSAQSQGMGVVTVLPYAMKKVSLHRDVPMLAAT